MTRTRSNPLRRNSRLSRPGESNRSRPSRPRTVPISRFNEFGTQFAFNASTRTCPPGRTTRASSQMARSGSDNACSTPRQIAPSQLLEASGSLRDIRCEPDGSSHPAIAAWPSGATAGSNRARRPAARRTPSPEHTCLPRIRHRATRHPARPAANFEGSRAVAPGVPPRSIPRCRHRCRARGRTPRIDAATLLRNPGSCPLSSRTVLRAAAMQRSAFAAAHAAALARPDLDPPTPSRPAEEDSRTSGAALP